MCTVVIVAQGFNMSRHRLEQRHGEKLAGQTESSDTRQSASLYVFHQEAGRKGDGWLLSGCFSSLPRSYGVNTTDAQGMDVPMRYIWNYICRYMYQVANLLFKGMEPR